MRLRRFALATLVAFACFTTAHAEIAVPAPMEGPSAPQVLSAEDARLYREIFSAERAGEFARADTLLDKVTDPSLKGYALAEKYLSPRSKRADVGELVSWLQNYNDLSIADRIYRLAVKRSTKKVRRHHKLVVFAIVTNIPPPAPMPHVRGGGYEETPQNDPPLSSEAGKTAQTQINAAIKADAPDQAMAVLQALDASNAAPPDDIARLSQRVAASYFAEGMDQQAYDLAARAAGNDERQAAPMLDWNAGLAAFRLGHFQQSAEHFEVLAQVSSVPNGIRSGAAFWAARAHVRAGEPEKVVTLLSVAAREEPTFYGLLSEKLLGVDTQSGFSEPMLDAAGFQDLMREPSAHRAAALWQIGERDDIDKEMLRAFGNIDPKLDPQFVALARRVNVPNLELRASELAAGRGIKLTGLFPVPQYKPDGGYTIDPALVLAFIRAESRFHADAVSPAGARGLMQLMPGTATHIAGAGSVPRLTDASYNMTLGQRYVAELLNQYNGNIIELCAAYNAGPLKVNSWMAAREGKEDDALLFIESMRAPETRLYVKRLLTYQWMYKRRLGLEPTTLSETASGSWPIYKPPHQSAPPPPPPAPATEVNDDALIN